MAVVRQERLRRSALATLEICAIAALYFGGAISEEKERGTLETLLSSPALRGEIVWGKLLTVMTFSAATAILNVSRR